MWRRFSDMLGCCLVALAVPVTALLPTSGLFDPSPPPMFVSVATVVVVVVVSDEVDVVSNP